MLLSEYHAELAAIIGRYVSADLIISSELTIDARTSKIGVVKGTLTFVDGARLFFTEYIDGQYRLVKLTYSYHFQDDQSRLLFRYDNASHKPTLPFVSHKHLSTGEIVEATAPDFASVLEEALQRFV